MATKSFLSQSDLQEALEQIPKPDQVPSGDESRIDDFQPHVFSKWLQGRLLERLKEHPSWKKSGPVALGSWSRDELTPKSDVDLLFCGDETEVATLTSDLAKQGLKLRYRMPQNPDDWTAGVEAFDILALISARALDPSVTELLSHQQKLIQDRWTELRRLILRAMFQERASRATRFDSISNYLEPNLKYGPGGLRDLEQALSLQILFPERFNEEDQHAFKVLSYYKRFFLLVRQRLHLFEGSTDLLTAPEQLAIAEWLGFKSSRDFMKELQKGVSRVSFYADWAFEQAATSKAKLRKVRALKLKKPDDFFNALDGDPSLLVQNRVRIHADGVFTKKVQRLVGKRLTQFLNPTRAEDSMVALFRSRLIDHCVPEFKRIVGHVQHDQYHRFSVDAHILQALRELSRVCKNPKLAGRISDQVNSLNQKEWEILSFACLYHDIAKGRAGDHAVEGIEVAKHDLLSFGKSDAFIREVTWIVEHHLALSAAAFRENPSSPRTWGALAEKGVEKRRIALLAVFTFVDIRATNPEAWTSWKERLLSELVGHLEKPEAGSAIAFAKALKKMKLAPEWVEKLDSFLVSMISPKKLSGDVVSYIRSENDLAPMVMRTRSGQIWIRFHSRRDRPGLFAHYVKLLVSAGLRIRHASIHTFEEAGVYDWFEVKTTRAPKQILRAIVFALGKLSETESQAAGGGHVIFDKVSLVSESPEEWVISFRGKDQPGALLRAAQALFAEGFAIRWARVHTWGRQIDDVFGVAPPQEFSNERAQVQVEEILERLNQA